MPTFIPPTVDEGPAGDNVLFRRYKLARGETVIHYDDGTVTTVRFPSSDIVEGQGGVARIYVGGHIYEITQAEATTLTNAGYGANVTP